MESDARGTADTPESAKQSETSIGQIIFDTLEDEVVLEREAWVLERIDSILKKLRQGTKFDKDYKVVVPWISNYTAFTAPGDYVFFSRKLFQECATEETAALIIAHEISHHLLGHLDKFPATFKDSTKSDMQILIAALYRVVETRIHGPELECDADRHALDMCIRAGYDPFECLKLFDKMEKMALDMGDIAGVFGPDEADDELLPDAPTGTKIKIWLYQRRRGYLPIRDRREMLLHHIRTHYPEFSNGAALTE